MNRFLLLTFGALVLLSGSAPQSSLATSPLPWRGIIEGAYGRTWTHGERMDMLRWMADHDMNVYVHAPKDDLYQRTQWRDPYPARTQAEFNREVRFAGRHGIQWVPNLSPALPLIPTLAVPQGLPSIDLCFACPVDLEAVATKLQPFLEAGTRTVMISFDDVTKLMTHPEDLARYGLGDRAFGVANGDFLTRLRERLRQFQPRVRVLTVGADYSGRGRTDYLDGLRSSLAEGIEVMWTGTAIPSEHWTASDAAAYGDSIGRTPVVWENWTNNDTAGNILPVPGTARLFLGPYIRDPAGATAVRGFFFNPANESSLNTLPLATAADWMADPVAYRPRAAWLDAVAELAPGAGRLALLRRESLRAWAETSWSNKLDREREAPTFVRVAADFLARYQGAGWSTAQRVLLRELRLVQLAPQRLAQLPDPRFAQQAAEFLDAARRTARAGTLATQLLAAERPSLRVRGGRGGLHGVVAAPDAARASELRSALDAAGLEARLDTEFTYGWRLGVAFEFPPYAVPGNVMDAFVDTVRSLDAGWDGGRASSAVSLDLAGNPVTVAPDGSFRLIGSACGKRLVATDGTGGATALRLRC